ncbi:MAG: hypothetical protein AVDCRST_MAG65-473, partial [uncultured Solirubrobacteraceae bacterium]
RRPGATRCRSSRSSSGSSRCSCCRSCSASRPSSARRWPSPARSGWPTWRWPSPSSARSPASPSARWCSPPTT